MAARGSTHLHVVEQSMNTLLKMDQYINAGMVTTEEIALDVIETDRNDLSPEMHELRNTMLEYAQMDNQLKQFLQAVDHVKEMVSRDGDCGDLEVLLEGKLKDLEDKASDPKQHQQYVDMEEKIEALLQGDDSESTEASKSYSIDDDLVMTQNTVNTRCPYTGLEMKDPVKNTLCGHSYDREGILQFINHKRGKAKCPVAGCPNAKPIHKEHLVPNKDIKNLILRNAKLTKKHPQRT